MGPTGHDCELGIIEEEFEMGKNGGILTLIANIGYRLPRSGDEVFDDILVVGDDQFGVFWAHSCLL